MDCFFQCQHLNLPPISRLTPSVKRSWSAPPHAHATTHARHTRWRHARRHSRHAWPLRLRHRCSHGVYPGGGNGNSRHMLVMLAWLQSMAFLWCQVFLNLEAFAKNLAFIHWGDQVTPYMKMRSKRSRDEITVRQVPCEVPRSPLIRYLVEFWGHILFGNLKTQQLT